MLMGLAQSIIFAGLVDEGKQIKILKML